MFMVSILASYMVFYLILYQLVPTQFRNVSSHQQETRHTDDNVGLARTGLIVRAHLHQLIKWKEGVLVGGPVHTDLPHEDLGHTEDTRGDVSSEYC